MKNTHSAESNEKSFFQILPTFIFRVMVDFVLESHRKMTYLKVRKLTKRKNRRIDFSFVFFTLPDVLHIFIFICGQIFRKDLHLKKNDFYSS